MANIGLRKRAEFAVAAAAVAAAMATLASVDCWKPVLHRVGGGRRGWRPGVDFANWTTHETFYVGDWLYFGFNKHYFNVLEVNKTGYDRCDGRGFITNVTRGGRDVFNLTEVRPFYFICSSGGHCDGGMKLSVDVVPIPPPSPSPESTEHTLAAAAAAVEPVVVGGFLIRLLLPLALFVVFATFRVSV